MALLFGKRRGEFGTPVRKALSWPRIDHVEGNTREDFCSEAKCGKGFFRRVLAAKRLQMLGIE